MARPARILLSAFACEPGKGSEQGNGWLWAEYLSRGHDVTVLTDARNRPTIEPALATLDRSRLRFVYIEAARPTHSKARLWVSLYRWQVTALHRARRLHAINPFDLAHHVTFGAHRLPSFLWRLGIPFLWGPVGGGEGVPPRFYTPRWMGWRETTAELARSLSNAWVRVDPLQRATATGASAIGVTTAQTRAALPRRARARSEILPSTLVDRATVDRLAAADVHPGPPTGVHIMYVGRLVGWKGPALAIRAFADHARQHPDARLDIYGSGRMRGQLEALVRGLELDDRVHMHGRVERGALLDAYGQHQIFLFPSLHDSSGFVTIEAQAAGLPVVCVDVGGPGQQVHPEAGVKVPPTTPRRVVAELSAALTTLTRDHEQWRAASRAGRRHALDPDATPTIDVVARRLYGRAGFDLDGHRTGGR